MKHIIKLPMFSGTYNTYWDYTPTDEDGRDLEYDRYTIDHKKMLESIGEAYVEYFYDEAFFIETVGIKKIKFDHSWSPKFYNFETDELYAEVDIDLAKLSVFIYENLDRFAKRIKEEHTSRDGFTSFHSNAFSEWEEDTDNFSEFEELDHKLSFLIQVAAEIEGIKEDEIKWEWNDKIYSNEPDFYTYIPLEWSDISIDSAFEDNLDKFDLEFGYVAIQVADAKKRSELFGTDWITELEDEVKIELLESIELTADDCAKHKV